MTNLIYQFWEGTIPYGALAGKKNMEEYAKRVGAEHMFEKNPKWIRNLGIGHKYQSFYGQFKIIYDESYDKYDTIMYADADVFAVDGLTESIFDAFEKTGGEVGLCTEPRQPQRRLESTGHINHHADEKWAEAIKQKYNVDMPRNEQGLLKVYNAGMVLYTKEARKRIREEFPPFEEYIQLIRGKGLSNFYMCDQPYLHAMLTVSNMNYVEMDNDWNQILHYVGKKSNPLVEDRNVNDDRTKDTKFVHIQLSNADNYDADTLYRITNLPQSEWKL